MSGLAPEAIIRLTDDAVEMLDQTRLPGEEVTLVCRTWPEVVDAIRRLAIRGAPAIGIAGAMGVALAARSAGDDLDAARAEVAAATSAALRRRRTGGRRRRWPMTWPRLPAGSTATRWPAARRSAPTGRPCSPVAPA